MSCQLPRDIGCVYASNSISFRQLMTDATISHADASAWTLRSTSIACGHPITRLKHFAQRVSGNPVS
jgi:hypothetical protein